MRKHVFAKTLILATLISGIASALTFAQGMGRANPIYNPATEVTVQGTVQELKQFTGPRGMIGTDVVLKSDQETLDVRLGPAAFLTQNKFELAKDDQIQATGSKVQISGANVLLAREVKKGEQSLTLRDAQGIPVWSRRGRR